MDSNIKSIYEEILYGGHIRSFIDKRMSFEISIGNAYWPIVLIKYKTVNIKCPQCGDMFEVEIANKLVKTSIDFGICEYCEYTKENGPF